MSVDYAYIQKQWLKLCPSTPLQTCLSVDTSQQCLTVYQQGNLVASYIISTAKNGLGCDNGSYKTPLGFHKVEDIIGKDEPINMLFKARKATGEIAQINDEIYLNQDSITSRILWLSGLEQGINLGDEVDTKQRYIYIHGTADEAHLGQAVSHGCIRMKNIDIIELLEWVNEQTVVYLY